MGVSVYNKLKDKALKDELLKNEESKRDKTVYDFA